MQRQSGIHIINVIFVDKVCKQLQHASVKVINAIPPALALCWIVLTSNPFKREEN